MFDNWFANREEMGCKRLISEFPNKRWSQSSLIRLLRTSSSAMAERPRELGDFKKARVNGLRIRTSISAAADRPAS